MRHKIDKPTFMNLWKRVEESRSGEPGFYFSNDKEWGCNPCCEIGLRPNQFCNLVEINASDVKDQTELNARARAASFIATLQASYTDFHYLRPVWKRTTEKEALIGVSMTGIASGGDLGNKWVGGEGIPTGLYGQLKDWWMSTDGRGIFKAEMRDAKDELYAAMKMESDPEDSPEGKEPQWFEKDVDAWDDGAVGYDRQEDVPSYQKRMKDQLDT